jgi:ABC-type uncharacterized transport system permease subunit
MIPPKIFLGAASFLYLVGFLVCFLTLAASRMHRFPWGEACVALGFASHLMACLLCPFSQMNLQHVLSLLAFAIVVIYFLLRALKRGQGLWLFAFPLVFALSFFALVLPMRTSATPAFSHTFFLLHIVVVLLGISGIFFGILYSLLYLFQEKALKEKHWGGVSALAPSLARADSFAIHSLWGGFILYTAGVGMGMGWSYWEKGMAASGSQKEIGAFLAWGIFALLLIIRARYGWRGRKALALYTLGVLSILAALGGIRVL